MNLLRTLKIHQIQPCLDGILLENYNNIENNLIGLIPYKDNTNDYSTYYMNNKGDCVFMLNSSKVIWVREEYWYILIKHVLERNLFKTLFIFLIKKYFKKDINIINSLQDYFFSNIEQKYKKENNI